jgi:hypothetical protein
VELLKMVQKKNEHTWLQLGYLYHNISLAYILQNKCFPAIHHIKLSIKAKRKGRDNDRPFTDTYALLGNMFAVMCDDL